MKEAEHRSLLGGTAGPMLRDPARSRLFFGFDGLTVGSEPDAPLAAAITYDGILQFAVAVGAARAYYPEAATAGAPPEIEDLLRKIDDAIGIRVSFPNPFPNEVGLMTSRGIATFRGAQSLCQAWRMTRLVSNLRTARFLEIGPGLGRTAYYAYQFGARDYTLIDIPLSNAAQGYFLGRVLGGEAVRLYGEQAPAPITIVPPAVFLDGTDQFDLVANFDSLTEMSRPVAEAYWRRVQGGTHIFLSVNHEHNAFTFRDIYTASGHGNLVARGLYWLRRGYVEEVATFVTDCEVLTPTRGLGS